MTSAPATTELCPGCFADKGLISVCPHCGYDESLKRGPLVLPHRTLLNNGQYLIGKVLGKPGGFGITYLALDTKLETRVAIKEYLPRDLAGRDGDHATVSAHSAEDGEFFRYGLTQFLQEARTLARFDHANIVRVRNFFEENGTGYLVMDYYDGITLADYLAQQPQGKLPEKTAVDILMPILDGLREVHAKNFLHRDIKPQNIYLTTGNRAILLDFGAARQAMGERSRSISVVLSEGYAPYEQYHRRGEQGPWTDIYACAAVLYHAVAGQAPPPATERVSKDELDVDALGVSASLANALRLGLATDHKNRPQTMAEFQGFLLRSDARPEIREVVQVEKTDLTRAAQLVTLQPIEPTQSSLWTSEKIFRALWSLAAVALIALVIVAIGKREKAMPTAEAPVLSVVDSAMQPGGVFKDCPECPDMVVIPSGSFEMGSNTNRVEEPVHTVNITSFALGKFEITRGQFSQFVHATGYKGGNECVIYQSGKGEKRSGFSWQNPGFPQNDNHPVVCVSWDDAKAYVAWLGTKTGQPYRLISEAEWEYAARANSTSTTYWGSNTNQACNYANLRDSTLKAAMPSAKEAGFSCTDGSVYTANVGSFKPNAFGLYDMLGNAWEWMDDCFDNNHDYYGAPSDGRASTAEQCSEGHIYRGGSWWSLAYPTNIANRERESSNYRDSDTGFRIARRTTKIPATADSGVAEATVFMTRARGLEIGGKVMEADRAYQESSAVFRRMEVSVLRKAAESGNAGAQNYLGYMYENGEKVTRDDLEAARWYRKAADQGDVAGQTGLGKMYLKTGNDAEAIRWLRKAADQEYTAAQYGLGMMYASGRGVNKDEVEAVLWFRKAAEKGHPYAKQELLKRDSQIKPVDLNQSVKSYVVVSGYYTTPARIRDECSRRYPSLTGLAKRTTDDYVVRNRVSFERATKQINLLIENYKDGQEKQDAQLMMTVLKPMLDQKTTEAIQPMLESLQKCEAILEKVGNKEMDLEKIASDQIARLNQ